jgi:hypothetical protein
MNDQLQSDLRSALRERASLVPDASVMRLTGIDYHPRRSRLRPPVAFGATATAGAAAGVAVLVMSLGTGATSAFAGWTAKPTAPAPGQLHAAAAACQASQSPVAGLPLELADTRGPYTFSIYADAENSATCIKGPSFISASGSGSSAPITVPDGQIDLSSSHQTDRSGQAFSFADGRTGAGVSGVTLVLADGTTVQATVANGWYLAWWPSGQAAKSAQITTSAGTTTEPFNSPGAGGPAPAGPAGAGVTSSSTGGFSGGGGQAVRGYAFDSTSSR